MKTYKKIGGVMVPESSSIGEVVPTDLDYCGGNFGAISAPINTAVKLPLLAIAGPLSSWKSSDTEITIGESGLYQIFYLSPNKSAADTVGTNISIWADSAVIAHNNKEGTVAFYSLPSTDFTGYLEAGMKISFSLYFRAADSTNAGGSFFVVRLTEKYPKVLYDSPRMPQHFVGPPDMSTWTSVASFTASGSYTLSKDAWIFVYTYDTSPSNSYNVGLSIDGKQVAYGERYSKSVNYQNFHRAGTVIGFSTDAPGVQCGVRAADPLWVLPVFVTGADLQSSTDPGYVGIEPDTKRMKVNGYGWRPVSFTIDEAWGWSSTGLTIRYNEFLKKLSVRFNGIAKTDVKFYKDHVCQITDDTLPIIADVTVAGLGLILFNGNTIMGSRPTGLTLTGNGKYIDLMVYDTTTISTTGIVPGTTPGKMWGIVEFDLNNQHM
jgi:hypothetical protein